MGKGENIWILMQALCPYLIGTVATLMPSHMLSITLAYTITMMLTEKKKSSMQKEINKCILYLIFFNKFYLILF
jgi:hypothetical protein